MGCPGLLVMWFNYEPLGGRVSEREGEGKREREREREREDCVSFTHPHLTTHYACTPYYMYEVHVHLLFDW